MPDEPADDRTEVRADERPATSARSARFAPGEMLAARYRIVAPLGRGGMGEVYRAEDTRLGQDVALKFLPERDVDARMLDRLVEEVRVGRQISHPNVCRLYDIVDAPGLSFIAMEFVDGEDLASLLRRIGRLPGDKALALTHDIAGGVAAAHDVGVIHRDLKPANIMIDGRGHAKITDFGLALLRTETARREVAGTVAYMAPEQLAGESAGIPTDVYALGLILFEMFTGRRLFDAESLGEIARLHRQPKPSLSDLVYDIDPEIERLILTCVDETPERRPRSAHEVVAQLPAKSRSAAGAARSGRETTSGGAREGKSIAVLPFEDLSPSKEDDYFSVGLAEEIISDLAKIKSLRVISRGSVMRFKGATDLPGVARELRVGYVLAGSIRKAGEQLRVTANLVDGRTDSILWSEKFRGTLDDIFDIQESVARTVAEQLRGTLTDEERDRLAERPISNVLAYEFYLKARLEILKFSNEGLSSALELLQKGLEVVGENVLIYAAMAYAHWQYFNAGLSADEANLRRAEELADKILAIEKDSYHGQRIRGLVAMSRGDFRAALILLRKAWAADSTDTDSLFWASLIAAMAGERAIGRSGANTLAAVDPFGPYALMAEFFVVWLEGRFEEMSAVAERLEKLDPENQAYPTMIAYAHLATGHRDEAARAIQHAAERFPEHFFTRLGLFLIEASRGRHAEASSQFEVIAAPARNDLQYSLMVAQGFALLGDADRAIDWLENAIDRGVLALEYLETIDPLLANVRGDARFPALMDRVRAESVALHRELEEAGVA